MITTRPRLTLSTRDGSLLITALAIAAQALRDDSNHKPPERYPCADCWDRLTYAGEFEILAVAIDDHLAATRKAGELPGPPRTTGPVDWSGQQPAGHAQA